MAGIAASFSSLLVLTDREGADSQRVYLTPPLFPRFPNFHFPCLVGVKSVSSQGDGREGEDVGGSVET